jgi:hypothetical protein
MKGVERVTRKPLHLGALNLEIKVVNVSELLR